MKTNHIPRRERLAYRINNLCRKLNALEPKPYGGSNPYYYCAACGRSMVEASYAGHYKGCKLIGLQNEIAHYTKLLNNT